MRDESPTRPSLLLQIRQPANQAAWEDFVRIYAPLIHGYCRQRELQEADAADVAQEVLRRVVTAIRRFDYAPERGSFRGWLLTVTRNRLHSFLAAQSRRPEPATESALLQRLEAPPLAAEEARWEEDYRQRLFEWAAERVQHEVKPATWEAFRLTALEERSAEEAAATIGLRPGAVYVARSRVTARLRELIRSVADDPPHLPSEPTRCPVV